jgi:transcriptional regulator with XRE-family HTH domain
MGNLYKNIVALCEKKGISGAKMCTEVGISKGLLTDLKMGRRTGVSAVTAQKIAAYFGVTVGYLLGKEEKEKSPSNDGLSEGEIAWLELYRMMPDEQTRAILVNMVEQFTALSEDAQALVLRLLQRDTTN